MITTWTERFGTNLTDHIVIDRRRGVWRCNHSAFNWAGTKLAAALTIFFSASLMEGSRQAARKHPRSSNEVRGSRVRGFSTCCHAGRSVGKRGEQPTRGCLSVPYPECFCGVKGDRIDSHLAQAVPLAPRANSRIGRRLRISRSGDPRVKLCGKASSVDVGQGHPRPRPTNKRGTPMQAFSEINLSQCLVRL
jgi:hypothetical protein